MRYATCLKAQIGSVRKMCCRKDVTLLQYCFKFQPDAAYKENKGALLASYFRTSRPDTVWLSGAAYFVEILLIQFAFPVLPKLAGGCRNIDVDYR